MRGLYNGVATIDEMGLLIIRAASPMVAMTEPSRRVSSACNCIVHQSSTDVHTVGRWFESFWDFDSVGR